MRLKRFNILKWFILLSPVFICLFGILACLLPYYISVYYTGVQSITTSSSLIKNKHNNKLHFISIYTNYLPSSGIFTICLSITNYFLFVIIFIKYFILQEQLKNRMFRFLNQLSLAIGFFIQITSIVLQSFHLHTNKHVHYSAGVLMISFMIVYLWLQTVFTLDFKYNDSTTVLTSKGVLLKLSRKNNEKLILFLMRFFLIFLITCLFISCLYFLNSILQWLTIVLILIYFLTFIYDFYFYDYKFKFKFCGHDEMMMMKSSGSNGNNSNKKKKISQKKKVIKLISTHFDCDDGSKINNQHGDINQRKSLVFTYV